jgi:hypothetical protein
VLLPGVKSIPKELVFLRELNHVQFQDSVDEREVVDSIEWGIRGTRS